MSLNVTFLGTPEVLQIIENRDELSTYFKHNGFSQDLCRIASVEIPRGKYVAAGSFGAVYRITLGDQEKNYAVKKTKNDSIEIYEAVFRGIDDLSPRSISFIFEHLHNKPNSDYFTFVSVNGGNPDLVLSPGDRYFIPDFANSGPCKLTRPINVEIQTRMNYYVRNTISFAKFTYPIGSYLCTNEAYSEAAIGSLASYLFESGTCANFISQFGFAMCSSKSKLTKKPELFDYTFLEFIQGDQLQKTLPSLVSPDPKDDDLIASIVIQTIFAISVLQRKFGIQHNDLHLGNIMLQELISGNGVPAMFNFSDLSDAAFLKYEIDGKKIYLRNNGFLVKLVDFGYSVKYSEPIIGRKDLVRGTGPFARVVVPAWQDTSYDFLVFFFGMCRRFDKNSMFLRNLFCKVFLDGKIDYTDDMFVSVMDGIREIYTAKNSTRPALFGLFRFPWEFLLDEDLVGKYMVKPSSDMKVVTVGKLTVDDYYEGFNHTPLHIFTPIQEINKTLEDSGFTSLHDTFTATDVLSSEGSGHSLEFISTPKIGVLSSFSNPKKSKRSKSDFRVISGSEMGESIDLSVIPKIKRSSGFKVISGSEMGESIELDDMAALLHNLKTPKSKKKKSIKIKYVPFDSDMKKNIFNESDSKLSRTPRSSRGTKRKKQRRPS
jgi:hypothetical protein